jgi:hypothetical protein
VAVEVVQRGDGCSYRLLHTDGVIGGWELTAVEDLFGWAALALG